VAVQRNLFLNLSAMWALVIAFISSHFIPGKSLRYPLGPKTGGDKVANSKPLPLPEM
jgi:hypothetical protein